MVVFQQIENRGTDVRAEDFKRGALALTANPDQGIRSKRPTGNGGTKVGDESRHRSTLQKDAGDFCDTPGSDAVEYLDDFTHPIFCERIRKGFINGALATGWQGAGFFRQTSGIGGEQEVGEADGGWIELEGFGRTNDFIAGGDELEGLTQLDTGGLFGTFVDVVEQALERFRIIFEGTDVGGDCLKSADHALDVAGGFEIRHQRFRRTAISDTQDNRFGALLGDSRKTALAEGFLGGIPPFFETGFGDDGTAEFLFQGIAGHAAAVAFEKVDDEGEWVTLDEAPKFFELLDFFRPEIIRRDPLGLLEGELEFHGLGRGLFEVDGDSLSREIPVGHLAGTEGFMNTKISGSQLRKALADRFRNATSFNQFRHVRMHAAEDGKPRKKTQGIPLINLSARRFHRFSPGGGTTRGRGWRGCMIPPSSA